MQPADIPPTDPPEGKSEAMPTRRRAGRLLRFMKGLLLVSWIMILLALAGTAVSGGFSAFVSRRASSFHSPIVESSHDSPSSPCPSPTRRLQLYLFGIENPPLWLYNEVVLPPIGSVLDALSEKWRDPDERCLGKGAAEMANMEPELNEFYHTLFRQIEASLRLLAADKTTGIREATIAYTMLPRHLRPENPGDPIKLSPEVAAWVNREREIRDQQTAAAQLLDTFLLLTVLGAFGSLIFLTRDYMLMEEDTGVAAYVFRPVLGVFLAMAVFAIDVFAHAVVSKASILQIRSEPLYVLALAAGLLSEQAYTIIRTWAEAALERYHHKPTAEVQASNPAQNGGAKRDD